MSGITRTFTDGPPIERVQSFAVARQEILAVLRSAAALQWGFHVEFAGSRDELIAAGVATADMFEGFGKSGARTDSNEVGDQFTIQRRAAGRYELTWRTYVQDGAEGIDGKRFRSCKWWREHGAEVLAEVDQALERMRQPRAVQP